MLKFISLDFHKNNMDTIIIIIISVHIYVHRKSGQILRSNRRLSQEYPLTDALRTWGKGESNAGRNERLSPSFRRENFPWRVFPACPLATT